MTLHDTEIMFRFEIIWTYIHYIVKIDSPLVKNVAFRIGWQIYLSLKFLFRTGKQVLGNRNSNECCDFLRFDIRGHVKEEVWLSCIVVLHSPSVVHDIHNIFPNIVSSDTITKLTLAFQNFISFRYDLHNTYWKF